jgi:hypothetical protein
VQGIGIKQDMTDSKDKSKIRRNTIILVLVAVAFYVAFIASMAARG